MSYLAALKVSSQLIRQDHMAFSDLAASLLLPSVDSGHKPAQIQAWTLSLFEISDHPQGPKN